MQQLGTHRSSMQEGELSPWQPHPREPYRQIGDAVAQAQRNLLGAQAEDGHWCGELEGDTILESEYILLLHFLGRTDEERASKAAEYLRRQQLPGGGWAIFPGGPPEVSASVKAYFVLKLLGDAPEAPHMERARRAILELGGVEAVNSFTKLYLSIFGQYDWWRCPAVPPEIVLLPRWFYFNLYEMSSWSRAIVVPLAIIWAHRPSCPVPPEASIEELFADAGERPPLPSALEASSTRQRVWRVFFDSLDRWIKRLERAGAFRPIRRRALARAESWILARLEASDGLGAIFPPIVNTILAFRCLGYEEDHPVLRSQFEELEKLEISEGDTLHLQPCKSPVWDTALALHALAVSGLAGQEAAALARAAAWLLDKEVRSPGDWRVKNPDGPVGGWYFEYANEFYPDCDDTAEVLTALAGLELEDGPLRRHAAEVRERALAWLLSMQNSDGGWGAFDKGCDKKVLTFIPFADHNAMIDPSSEDITGRVLEMLAAEGFDISHPVARRAVEFLRARQEDDGTWYGRWGANYIYGTWLALAGLAAIGEDMEQEPYQRAAGWLRQHQNPDGGWGESLRTYDEPQTKGEGTSTAAQTAWALLALLATGDAHSESVHRGIEYLLSTQQPDGSWKDEPWTATGFPQVFYLRYDLYDDYFPLLALSTYLAARERQAGPWRERGPVRLDEREGVTA